MIFHRLSHIQTAVRKVLPVLACMALSGMNVYGQNDIQLSQQMFSRINYNPAATGISEDIQLYLLARQQWVGFKFAPRTIVLNGHTFIPWTRSGWGFSITGDQLGYEKSMNPKFRYAYHVPLVNIQSSLSLGIGAGIMYKTVDGNRLVYENPADPNRITELRSSTRPDFDFGVEYNSKYLSVGTSITHLGNRFNNTQSTESSPHLYGYARAMLDINKQWQVSPALSWHNSKTVNQFEANALLLYKKTFWIGASYRANESVVGLAGVYLTPQLMLGYSYDYNANFLGAYSKGSHEIMLSWRIPQPDKARKATRMRECRYDWW
jgi:type IX secretion system PorP/SprF family membrane protein